jgi:hypothetical protein
MIKIWFYLLENMHENKTFFLYFWNGKFEEKSSIFNTEFVSYIVSLQPNIKWNSWIKTYFYVFW